MELTITGGRGPSVELLPGVHFSPKTVRATGHGSGLDIEVDVSPQGGRLVATAVRASQREGGQPVTLAALRSVALSPFLKAAAGTVFVPPAPDAPPPSIDPDEPWETVFWGLLTVAERDRLKAQGPTSETLHWVAIMYQLAEAINEPPVKALANAFGCSSRTINNWVAAAREAGEFDDR